MLGLRVEADLRVILGLTAGSGGARQVGLSAVVGR